MRRNEISVYDPLKASQQEEQPANIHYSTIRKLKVCMEKISRTILQGWQHNFQSVKVKYITE
jgi:hypothetical protein